MREVTPYLWIRPPPGHLPQQAGGYSRMSWEVKRSLQVILISPCPCDCSGIGTEEWSRFCLVWKCPWWSLPSQFHLACSERWKFVWNFDTDCGQSPKWDIVAIIIFKIVFFSLLLQPSSSKVMQWVNAKTWYLAFISIFAYLIPLPLWHTYSCLQENMECKSHLSSESQMWVQFPLHIRAYSRILALFSLWNLDLTNFPVLGSLGIAPINFTHVRSAIT